MYFCIVVIYAYLSPRTVVDSSGSAPLQDLKSSHLVMPHYLIGVHHPTRITLKLLPLSVHWYLRY